MPRSETALAGGGVPAQSENGHLNGIGRTGSGGGTASPQERYRAQDWRTYITVLDSQRSAVNAEAEHIGGAAPPIWRTESICISRFGRRLRAARGPGSAE